MPTRYCPACRRTAAGGFLDATGRSDARCPNCQSLERHRSLALLLDALAPYLATRVGRVLDIAPVTIIRRMLEGRFGAIHYTGADIAPAREVDVLGDVTSLPFRNAAFQLVVCYHVLEHVLDDRAAMVELRRVLAPGGIALVQVPRRLEEATDDGPLVPPETAGVRFGQDDHVRWYGWDFDARLADAGLVPLRVRPRDLTDEDGMERMRLDRREEMWLCRAGPAGSPAPVGDLDGILGALLPVTACVQQRERELARLRSDLADVRGERDRLRRFHRRLTGHPVWRAARWLRRRLR